LISKDKKKTKGIKRKIHKFRHRKNQTKNTF